MSGWPPAGAAGWLADEAVLVVTGSSGRDMTIMLRAPVVNGSAWIDFDHCSKWAMLAAWIWSRCPLSRLLHHQLLGTAQPRAARRGRRQGLVEQLDVGLGCSSPGSLGRLGGKSAGRRTLQLVDLALHRRGGEPDEAPIARAGWCSSIRAATTVSLILSRRPVTRMAAEPGCAAAPDRPARAPRAARRSAAPRAASPPRPASAAPRRAPPPRGRCGPARNQVPLVLR